MGSIVTLYAVVEIDENLKLVKNCLYYSSATEMSDGVDTFVQGTVCMILHDLLTIIVGWCLNNMIKLYCLLNYDFDNFAVRATSKICCIEFLESATCTCIHVACRGMDSTYNLKNDSYW
jgi:hypothetical protein